MAIVVKINNGRVEEYENGSYRRSYGSNIVAAATDGKIVAAVRRDGRVEEYENGSYRRSYGTDAVGVQVAGGTVAIQKANGRATKGQAYHVSAA